MASTSTHAEKILSVARDGCSQATTSAQVSAGIRLVFHSLCFLRDQRSLWKLALVPILINTLIFLAAATALYWGSSNWVNTIWPEPQITTWTDTVLVFAWWLMKALVVVLVGVLSYFFALTIGGLLSVPFLDELSLQCEKILYGPEQTRPQSAWSTITSTVSSCVLIGLSFVLYTLAMLPVLLLFIIPGGGLVAIPLSFGLSGCFLCFQYCDPVFARHDLSWRSRVKLLWRFRGFSFGFGLGAQALLWIPLANLLAIPVVVVAGTCVGATIATRDQPPHTLT